MDLKSKFCPKCGKKTAELVRGLCPKCYYEENKVELPKRLEIMICKNCGAIKFKGEWIKTGSWKNWIGKKLLKKIKPPQGIQVDNLKIVDTGESGKVRIWLSVGNKAFTEARKISITIKEKVCSSCGSRKKRQWNAKVQLRADDDFIKEVLPKAPAEYVNRIKPVTNGVDIYFSSKNEGKSFARNLKKQYDLESKSSYEQRGWNNSKSAPYKMNVILLRKARGGS